ncbi:MAG: sigma-70 family RNA polymerase sigma factor [Actinobacteria bacterium]|nr:sigma-70 family RNA polymerase sigma factor [Actinomycetota bacterium]
MVELGEDGHEGVGGGRGQLGHGAFELGHAAVTAHLDVGAVEVEELHALLAGLSDRERDVLRARYGLDDDGEERSLRSVGDRLGLSGERVRQIERRALSKLAAAATDPSGRN